MGFMDTVDGMIGGQGNSKAALLQAAMGLIQNHPGGLQGLLAQFQSAGLGDHVASWVGSGPNQPITPGHVEQALGPDQLNNLAQQAGVAPAQTSAGLASLLPEIVNHLTPSGTMPSAGQLQQGLGGLISKFLG